MFDESSKSFQRKEQMYYSSLTQYGVEHSKAFKAARIMASGKPDELLTHEELQLVYEVCKIWSSMYKRRQYFNSIIKSIPDKS
jgi:ABC-type cobalamin/Fe3+-siderophores transport system ATPase subunit